jgi:hypothetical protein
MSRIQTFIATLSLASFAIVGASAGAAEPTSPPSAVQPATPVVNGTKITKSRSNIQNNRQAKPLMNPSDAPAPAPESKGVVKTKTKSNQSND